MDLEKAGKRFRKKFRIWLYSQIKDGNYKGILDACEVISKKDLKVKGGHTVRAYLYRRFPVAPHHAVKLSELTGISLKSLNPKVWQ